MNVIAPLPSVSPTSCLKKSLLHMILSMQTCLASASSKTWLQILPITFLVQCGRSSSSSLSSLHAFAKPLNASCGTFVLHVGTSTAPASVSRNNLLVSLQCPELLLRPPRLLPFSSSHPSILWWPRQNFRRISCSIHKLLCARWLATETLDGAIRTK